MDHTRFSCWLVGETSLAIRCGSYLLGRGHRIVGVASTASEVKEWAHSKSISAIACGKDMAADMSSHPFDLLFSVFNRTILPQEVLSLPRIGSINYHDSLLPRYSGLHATSWALLDCEANYGITWHWMTFAVDAGPILIQRQLSITSDETALSLNLKCMEAAEEAFTTLLQQLERAIPLGTPQDETQRTWYERFHRPPNAGLLSWNDAIQRAGALIRCLDFGSRGNPLAMAGLVIANSFYGVGAADIEAGSETLLPGTISGLQRDELTVSLKDGKLRIRELVSTTGRTMSVSALADQHGLEVGQKLSDPTESHRQLLADVDSLAARAEGFWRKRLSSLTPLTLSSLTGIAYRPDYSAGSLPKVCHEWVLPLDSASLEDVSPVEVTTAAIAAFLACLHGEGSFDLGLPSRWPEFLSPPMEPVPWAPVFSPIVFLRVQLQESTSFTDFVAATAKELSIYRQRGVFRQDIIARTPVLYGQDSLKDGVSLPILVLVDDVPLLHSINEDVALRWSISADGRRVSVEIAASWNHELEVALSEFQRFTASLLALPDDPVIQQPLRRLLLSSPAKRQLVAWSRGRNVPVPEGNIYNWILETAQAFRLNTALEVEQKSLSYADLQARITQLSAKLSLAGVSSGSVVALLLHRSPELYVAMLAIMNSGAAYLPLDPDWPSQRVEQTLAQLPPTSLLLSRKGVEHSHIAWQGIKLDYDDLVAERPSGLAIGGASQSAELAYVIFTSGSTGQPKGVEIKHSALANYIHQAGLTYCITAKDRVLQFHSPAFDASVEEIFVALTTGATLVARSPDMLDSPRKFLAEVQRLRLSVLILPTAFWAQLLTEMKHEHLSMPCCVRLVVIGGEKVSSSQFLQWCELASSAVRLVNTYGPTECTVVATWHELVKPSGDDLTHLQPDPPIGRPVPNVSTWVLDPAGRLCASGVPGELYIGGAGVARGYLGLSAITSQKFTYLPSGLSGENDGNERVYRTGDKVAWNIDGTLQYLGRLDRQIKLRGFRIQPGEIEYALGQHPSVDGAAVVLDEADASCPRLVAFWTALAGLDELPTDADLRHFLQSQLPTYMQPAAFERLQAFPLSSSGKVDLRALPVLSRLRQVSDEVSLEQNPAATVWDPFQSIWCDLLRLNSIGLDDDVFLLGADSLTAAAAAGRLSRVCGLDISAGMVFLNPTIRRLRSAIESLDSQPRTAIERLPRDADLLVSPSQERLWQLIHSTDTYNHAYHLQVVFRLRGRVDIEILKQVLALLIKRHEILRTTFHDRGFGHPPMMRVHQPWNPEVDTVLIESDPGLPLQEQLQAAVEDLSREPFDLELLPLVRWRVARLPCGPDALIHCEHHLIHDGWTLHLLIKDICDIYAALSRGEHPAIQPRTFEFAEAAWWQRRYLDETRTSQMLGFWTESLSGVPEETQIPSDRPRTLQADHSGSAIEQLLPAHIITPLRSFCKEINATLFDGMFAVFAILIARLSGQSDLCIGSGVANRRLGEMESVAGMFVNNIALRIITSEADTFVSLVSQVCERKRLALDNQDLPFEQVVRAVNPDRQPGRHPLFQLMFSFHDSQFPSLSAHSLIDGHAITFNNNSAKFDLNLIGIPQQVGEDEGGVILWWEYSTCMYERSRIECMTEIYECLVKQLILNPCAPVHTLEILPGKHSALLDRWVCGLTPLLPTATIPELFEQQVNIHSQSVALVSSGQKLTYDQLNRRANQLVHLLMAKGVLPNDLVALCLARSPAMVVAMLAIMKSGAAYLPIDPEAPPQRVQQILADSAAVLLLTSSPHAKRAPDSVPTLILDSLDLGHESDANLHLSTDPSRLAYVNYTSGSTGSPKGVLVEHRSVVRLIRSNEAFAIHNSDVCLQLAPLAFDAATLEIWGALLNGARLILFPPGPVSLPELAGSLHSHGVSTLWLTAGLFNLLVDEHLDALAGVRQVLAGGDVLSPSHVQRLLDAFPPGHHLINGYGPTENTTFTCCHVMEAGDRVSPKRIPIGKPISHTTVHVLDAAGNRCPIGVIGELHIGGLGLARGYLGDPELTAQSFIPNPFSSDHHARLFKSGDLASWNPDGTLSFHGRIDQQIKLRGFRIEPAEIETNLLTHPDVAQAVVVLRQANPDNSCLIAYWVPQQDSSGPAGSEQLHSFLAERLPAYMVPSVFIQLEALPLTPNGKLDRAALPDPNFSENRIQYVTPSRDLECWLHVLWSEVLGHGDFGIHESFFRVGGHSLAAARLASRIADRLQVSFPMARIFEAQTIAAQVSLLALPREMPDICEPEKSALIPRATPIQIDSP